MVEAAAAGRHAPPPGVEVWGNDVSDLALGCPRHPAGCLLAWSRLDQGCGPELHGPSMNSPEVRGRAAEQILCLPPASSGRCTKAR